jgi:hypothetical protein
LFGILSIFDPSSGWQKEALMSILAPIPINFNKVEIGAILVNHLRNQTSDKDSHKSFKFKGKSGSFGKFKRDETPETLNPNRRVKDDGQEAAGLMRISTLDKRSRVSL